MANVHSFQERFQRSVTTFSTQVWPLVGGKFGPGELIPIEDLNASPLALMFDRRCGIDHLFCPLDDGEPFGIAQRVCRGNWDTFTMSVPIYQRLAGGRARPHGRLGPAVHIQAYTVEDIVRRVGMVATDDLIGYAVEHPREEQHNHNGGPFYCWAFEELVDAGVPIDLFPAPRLMDPFR